MTRHKEIKAHEDDLAVSEEVYKLARLRADNELATMRDNMFAVHNVGLVAGRAQAFGSIKLLSEFLEYKQLAQVIDSKDFLKIPGVTNIDDYLEKLGLGRSTAFSNLKIARTLTAEEVQLLGQVGFTRRDLLSYASLPEEKRLEIREGKVINIESASREEIKDVIEEVIAESHRVKEEAETLISAKDKVLKSKGDVINKMERELKRFEKDAAAKGLTPDEDAYIQQINNLKTGFDGYLLRLENYTTPDEYEPLNPLKKAALISATHYMKMRILALHDTVTMEFGNPVTNPEILEEFEAWERDQAQTQPQKK